MQECPSHFIAQFRPIGGIGGGGMEGGAARPGKVKKLPQTAFSWDKFHKKVCTLKCKNSLQCSREKRITPSIWKGEIYPKTKQSQDKCRL